MRRTAAVLLAAVGLTMTATSWADEPASASAPTRTEAPDGAPTLSPEATVNNRSTSVAPRSAGSVIVEEERVQGRLANARISVGGRAYSIVDPNAGRVDRQAGNGGKRVTPSMWELLRF